MTIAAAGGVVWKSLAITCSSGSITRASAWTMKAAMPSTSSEARSRVAGGAAVRISETGMHHHATRRPLARSAQRWSLRIHRPAVAQRQPAADDPVDEPEADDAERQPRDQDADAEGRDDKEHAERDPEQAEPERAYLPAEVRFQPGAADLATLH